MDRLPWFALYPGDWKRQTALLTQGEKGYLADVLCIMHDMADRGKLAIDGKPLDDGELELLATLPGDSSTKTPSKLLAKLQANGAIKREAKTGIYYDERMVKEERKRLARQRLTDMRSEIGRIGGVASGSKRRANAEAKSNILSLSLSDSNIKKLREKLLSEADQVNAVKKAAYEIVRGKEDCRHVFNRTYTKRIRDFIEKLGSPVLIDDLLSLVGKDINFPLDYCLERKVDETACRWEMMSRRATHERTKQDHGVGAAGRYLVGHSDQKSDTREKSGGDGGAGEDQAADPGEDTG